MRGKGALIHRDLFQRKEPLSRGDAARDPQFDVGRTLHRLEGLVEVLFLTYETPGARVPEDVVKLSGSKKEVHWKDNCADLGQGVVGDCPLNGVGHHEHAHIAGTQSFASEPVGQSVRPGVQIPVCDLTGLKVQADLSGVSFGAIFE
jgi:hypothetical protein